MLKTAQQIHTYIPTKTTECFLCLLWHYELQQLEDKTGVVCLPHYVLVLAQKWSETSTQICFIQSLFNHSLFLHTVLDCVPTSGYLSAWFFSLTQHSSHDFALPRILGHTLHYSSCIQLGGELSFCLGTLCHLTLGWDQPLHGNTFSHHFSNGSTRTRVSEW